MPEMTWLITWVDANPITIPLIVVIDIKISAGTANNRNIEMMMIKIEIKRKISFTPFTASAGNLRYLVLRLIKPIATRYMAITVTIVPSNAQISTIMHHAKPTVSKCLGKYSDHGVKKHRDS
nr:hypothetical protein [Candidatus Sigynarchaeum springense]